MHQVLEEDGELLVLLVLLDNEQSCPYVSNGDYLVHCEKKSGNWDNKTMYWLVEVMDGKNLVYLLGDTTLSKVPCPR